MNTVKNLSYKRSWIKKIAPCSFSHLKQHISIINQSVGGCKEGARWPPRHRSSLTLSPESLADLGLHSSESTQIIHWNNMPAALPLYGVGWLCFLQPGPNFNYQHRQSISNEGLTRYTSLEHAPLQRARSTNKHITQDHAAVCQMWLNFHFSCRWAARAAGAAVSFTLFFNCQLATADKKRFIARAVCRGIGSSEWINELQSVYVHQKRNCLGCFLNLNIFLSYVCITACGWLLEEI